MQGAGPAPPDSEVSFGASYACLALSVLAGVLFSGYSVVLVFALEALALVLIAKNTEGLQTRIPVLKSSNKAVAVAGAATRLLRLPLLAALLLGSSVGIASAQSSSYCQAGQSPQFSMGFASLRAQVGPVMGSAIQCEHPNSANGDMLQSTTTGLAFYRKSTNTPTFTDGYYHWGLTAQGLVAWVGADVDPAGPLQNPAPAPHLALPAPLRGIRRWERPLTPVMRLRCMDIRRRFASTRPRRGRSSLRSGFRFPIGGC